MSSIADAVLFAAGDDDLSDRLVRLFTFRIASVSAETAALRSSVPDVSPLLSPSSVNPAHAALGELPPVVINSGVGDRPFLAPSRTMCGGMKRGGEGDEVAADVDSGKGKWRVGDGDWGCCEEDEALEPSNIEEKLDTGESGVSARESLRFLCRDVMKDRALFPCGNKAYWRSCECLAGCRRGQLYRLSNTLKSDLPQLLPHSGKQQIRYGPSNQP